MTSLRCRRALTIAVAALAALAVPPRAVAAGKSAPAKPAAAKPASGPQILQLDLSVKAARAEVRLNGFPLGHSNAAGAIAPFFTAPLNPYLAGKRNVLELVVDAAKGPDGKPLPMTGAAVEVTVRRFAKGDMVEPGAGALVTRYAVPKAVLAELASGKRKPPVTVTHPFASEGPDFSAELHDAPPFADEAALRDYAMKLRGLAEKGDVDALLAEFGPKVSAYATAYAEPEAALAESLKQGLAALVEAKPDVAFGRDDVEPVSCAGGRVWELRRKGGAPLLRAPENADGFSAQIPVYVAARNGVLRVVR